MDVEKKHSKLPSLFGKLFSTTIFLVIGYFLVQWLIGNIASKPLAELTLKDIASVISALLFALGITIVIINSWSQD